MGRPPRLKSDPALQPGRPQPQPNHKWDVCLAYGPAPPVKGAVGYPHRPCQPILRTGEHRRNQWQRVNRTAASGYKAVRLIPRHVAPQSVPPAFPPPTAAAFQICNVRESFPSCSMGLFPRRQRKQIANKNKLNYETNLLSWRPPAGPRRPGGCGCARGFSARVLRKEPRRGASRSPVG